MVSAPDSLVGELNGNHYSSQTVSLFCISSVLSVADDESAHPKGIQYKPTSRVLHILLFSEQKPLDNLYYNCCLLAKYINITIILQCFLYAWSKNYLCLISHTLRQLICFNKCHFTWSNCLMPFMHIKSCFL